MKSNELSSLELNTDAVDWLKKLYQTLTVKEYGRDSVRNYCQEMKLLCVRLIQSVVVYLFCQSAFCSMLL